ncbi:hypothetical protein [Cytobacillus firmus]|uniref:Uncharacterized protein n=1 Tax=Cytobacillus firmus TaxID=1399 RepID=A0AA46SJY1_CYTFI|nr:hypothetical protein [Cytobacillus firmus]UYG96652.1 hypothetical protein OD459_06370 [Cytobacillus firmus]
MNNEEFIIILFKLAKEITEKPSNSNVELEYLRQMDLLVEKLDQNKM